MHPGTCASFFATHALSACAVCADAGVEDIQTTLIAKSIAVRCMHALLCLTGR
jgi:hypothetical protein